MEILQPGLSSRNERVANVRNNGETVKLNSLTNCQLAVAIAVQKGKWVHGYIIKNGVSLNSLLGISLLDMYVQCGNITDAHWVYNELPVVDLVSWTTLILTYAQRGHPSEAMELITIKKWQTMIPNFVTIIGLLSACSQLRNVTMVDMYAECDMDGYVLSWFHRLRSSSTFPDVVALVNIISACTYAHGMLVQHVGNVRTLN
ncbi:pentatricopeptide repeat-containing protein At2g03380, mitochondrial-like [Aristolochia californica]|uniref:pentatricopeptide repeat-containing protein At2g03380, mitochondrial-like n=1 Tax=Aristolochia californica TaxID=171875 RepID=UPI0035DE8160